MRPLQAFLLANLAALSGCQCSRAGLEDCQNQTDDDDDGFVDCDDTDCSNVVLCHVPGCGDGVLDPEETCDDGAANSDTTPDACRSDCSLPSCGDLVVDTGELCDDGNNIQNDGCHLCTIITQKPCGNGALDAGEQCDDGNLQSGDGCSLNCTIEGQCGDGVIEGAERCDDQNTTSGDGCASDCAIESGFTCFGEPSICSACGDGVQLPNEVCVSASTLPTDPDPFALALFDKDNDGDQDLIVSLNLGNQIWVYQNDAGQLSISQVLFMPPDSIPGGVAIADLDDDGDQDAVVTASNLNRVQLLENQGGALALGVDLFVGVNPDFGVVVQDLNSDGLLDIAVVNTDSTQTDPQDTITILFSQGGVTFDNPVSIDVAETPFALVAADLSGDGFPELVSGNLDSSTLSLLPNDGAFGASQTITQSSPIAGLAVGDIDQDNDLDLIATRLLQDDAILFTNSAGTLSLSQTLSVGGSLPVGVVLADINGDAALDIATANIGGSASIILQHQGALLPPVSILTDIGAQPITAGDLNQDGRADLIVGNRTANSVTVLLSAPF